MAWCRVSQYIMGENSINTYIIVTGSREIEATGVKASTGLKKLILGTHFIKLLCKFVFNFKLISR